MRSKHLPDDGRLQAYLDGELPRGERPALEAHVRSCADCARSLEELRAAAVTLRAVVERHTPAAARNPEAPHPAFLRRMTRNPTRTLTRAAGIVLLLAGSAAVLEATTGWLGAAVRAVRASVEATVVPAAPAPEVVPANPSDALFTVQPRGGTLEVLLENLDPGTRVVVRLGETPVGEVRIGTASDGVTYRAGPGTASVSAPGVAELEVVLPASLQSGRVVANGATAIVKAPDRLFSVRAAEEIVGGFRFRVPD